MKLVTWVSIVAICGVLMGCGGASFGYQHDRHYTEEGNSISQN